MSKASKDKASKTEERKAKAAETVDEALAKEKQADALIRLAQPAKLFHTPGGVAYADVTVSGHRETWPVRRRGFKQWLLQQYYGERKGAPNSDAMQAAVNVIDAKAQFEGTTCEVYTRVAGHGGRCYLDLCNDRWSAVEIDATGWRVIDKPPVRFHRANGMRPLPIPVPGGSIKDLRDFLNVKTDEDFVLAVSFQLAALRAIGPYPLLNLMGPPGAAKTTSARVIRAPVDPNATPMRGLSREERDLFISARNSHIQGIDNAKRLPDWLSDALCRLSTGGGFATRELYENLDEIIINVIKPTIATGIAGVITAPDLMDRSIPLQLGAIRDEDRKIEEEFWAGFNEALPRIMGALLDGFVTGLRRLPEIKLAGYPRMADFAKWATACETAYWSEGTFMRAYQQNIVGATEEVIGEDVVATALLEWFAGWVTPPWKDTATILLELLTEHVGKKVAKSKFWPKDGTRLSGRLRKFEPGLRQLGVGITFNREPGGARIRTIEIAKITASPVKDSKTASRASPASQSNSRRDFRTDASGTLVGPPASQIRDPDDRDAVGMPASPPASSAKSLKTQGTGRWDARDANLHPITGEGPRSASVLPGANATPGLAAAGNGAGNGPLFVRRGAVRPGTCCHVCRQPGTDANPVVQIECTLRPEQGSWALHFNCAPRFFQVNDGLFGRGGVHVFDPDGGQMKGRRS